MTAACQHFNAATIRAEDGPDKAIILTLRCPDCGATQARSIPADPDADVTYGPWVPSFETRARLRAATLRVGRES